MNTHANRLNEIKNQSVANSVFQKQSSSKSTFQFVDNRLGTITQRKLQEMANNSQQAQQVGQLQAMTDAYTSQQQQIVFQLAGGANAYDAGEGAYWHVHYGDHVKFGGLAETRINFDGRTRNKILRQLRAQRNVPPQSQKGGATYIQCVNWILRNR